MSDKPKKSPDPRMIVVMTPEFLTRIDNYRYAAHIPTRSDAVRRMLEAFLDDFEKNAK